MSIDRRLELAVVAVLGALQTWAYVYTESAWWLPILCVALLVWRVNAASSARCAAMLGLVYGTAWLCAGTWWLFISLHRFGGLPAWLAVLAVLALSAALSLYLAAACGLYRRWRTRAPWLDAALFAVLWLLAELARALIFTGFPWLASGYSQIDAGLALLAPWVGVYGMGAVLAFAAALLGGLPHTMPGRRWPMVMGMMLVFGLPMFFGPMPFTTSAGTLSVTLLQGNVAQDEKFSQERMPEAMAWVASALSASRAELVVAPETAVPLLSAQLAEFAPGYWDALSARFRGSPQVALVGVPLGDFERGYSNSVVALGGGAAYHYDKFHLVPFGEFIPTGFRWFTELMNIPLGDFSRGGLNQPSLPVRGQRVAPNICYEDLYGEELARRFVDAALAPTLFVNVSNIGWFGNTIAIGQHLNISRLRTLELQRPMLRATNTGATAIIDHHGRVIAALPPYQRAVLEGQVEGRHGVTPYAWWAARFGLWPLLLLALAVIAAIRLLSPAR